MRRRLRARDVSWRDFRVEFPQSQDTTRENYTVADPSDLH